jgi:hypothetical protein
VRLVRVERLLSDEHFTADSTLTESLASLKSLHKKGGGPPRDGSEGTGMVDFPGARRSGDTHESSTDRKAELIRHTNGQPAKLCLGGHAFMESRLELCVDLALTDPRFSEPAVATAPRK